MRVLYFITMGLLSSALLVRAAERANSSGIDVAARAQIGQSVRCDPSFLALEHPDGDVPIEAGGRAVVVVRALGTSVGMDLQGLVHVDMKRNFSQHPQIWGLKAPGKNINHQRVPNLQAYFKWSVGTPGLEGSPRRPTG